MVSMPGTPRSVPVVRHWLAEVMAAHGCSGVDDALLVASELAGNAVRHTRSGEPGGRLVVVIAFPDEVTLRLEVIDEGAETVPRPRDADWDMESGRGLWLVEQVSRSWGEAALRDGRHAVWADLESKRVA
ncbi:ATP-binding protein [Spongiactinospora rosea]|uniref:ATP-binding protein n=2 Tax=Spongiactinospora rosea TaxID=2248750 RepID=A0A366LQE1_9ACTN|nr:ATP-binding protein [Spongiactinospora rosea]